MTATVATCVATDLAEGHVVVVDHVERTVARKEVRRAGVHIVWTDGSSSRFSPEATLTIRWPAP